MKLLEGAGIQLFYEEEPRIVVVAWLISTALVQAFLLGEMASTLSSESSSPGFAMLLIVSNAIPFALFFASLKNVNTQPGLKIYEDHLVVTNFGKTTVVLIEKIMFLRRIGPYLEIVEYSGARCLIPVLPSARYARELIEDLTDWDLADTVFEIRKKSTIAWIIVVAMLTPFIMIAYYKIVLGY